MVGNDEDLFQKSFRNDSDSQIFIGAIEEIMETLVELNNKIEFFDQCRRRTRENILPSSFKEFNTAISEVHDKISTAISHGYIAVTSIKKGS
jgi:hypothetical protein